MFLSISEETCVSQTLFYHGFNTFAIGLVGWSIALEIYFICAYVFHFEFLFICQKFLDEIEGSKFLLVFFILEHWFSFWHFNFLFACQSQDLLEEERGIVINQAKKLIVSLCFALPFPDVDAGPIAERQDGLALVVPGCVDVVFGEAEWFLSHLV